MYACNSIQAAPNSKPETLRIYLWEKKIKAVKISSNNKKIAGTSGKNKDNIAPRKNVINHQSIAIIILKCSVVNV
jgi:hypothetical protein